MEDGGLAQCHPMDSYVVPILWLGMKYPRNSGAA